jgi:tyrosinase
VFLHVTSNGFVSALTPFHKSSSTFYTSASVRSTRAFGYTYPELVDWGVTASQLQSNLRIKINSLYAPAAASTTHQRRMEKLKLPNGTRRNLLPLVDSATNRTAANEMIKPGVMTVEQCVQMGVNNLPIRWALNWQVDKYVFSHA